MAMHNPLANAYPKASSPVSKRTYCIGGLLTLVYGLDELQADVTEVACLWLLHPRLQDQRCMEPIACSSINAWNDHVRQTQPSKSGLIAVSIDQRNHGSRVSDSRANEDWRHGNKTHAQDMFSIYSGTVTDVSQSLDMLASYIFPMSEHVISRHIACGVSLGGHAAWQCLFNDARFTAAIVVIGCPDFLRLMSDRAALSKLDTAASSFVGSKDFPASLVEAVRKYDPAGQCMGVDAQRDDRSHTSQSDDGPTTVSSLYQKLRGKSILNLSGGADKLVPYRATLPFIDWLKRAVGPGGRLSDAGTVIEDHVYDGVGHEFNIDMAERVKGFVLETMQQFSMSEEERSKL